MDFEALKDQWNEVEDRDGVRLSWNVFPSTRMVSAMAKIYRVGLMLYRKPRGLLCLSEPYTHP